MSTSTSANASPLLELRGVSKAFPIERGLLRRTVGWVQAVQDVSLSVRAGEVVALVGESGSGKSTVARLALGLLQPTAGEVSLDGVVLATLSPDELRQRRRVAQLVFQDPQSSLNPRHTVARAIALPLLLHGVVPESAVEAEVARLLELVGLPSALARRYPHELSGGQRQRVGVARALAPRPRLLICDEAVSALDVSVQAQLLNLFGDLRRELGLAYLFIAHDLGVVRHLADRVAVMSLGRIVETGETARVFAGPEHPYTRELLRAMPSIERLGWARE